MAKLVVCALELAIRDPDGDALALAEQPLVDLLPGVLSNFIRRGSESSDPKLPPHPLVNTVDGISQATIAGSARLKVPAVPARDTDLGQNGRSDIRMATAGHRARLAALDARGRQGLCMGRLEQVLAHRRTALDNTTSPLLWLAGGFLGEPGELGERIRAFLRARAGRCWLRS